VVTELLRHKRVDLALEAARRAGLRSRPSAQVGSWSDCVRDTARTLRSLGRIGDRELKELYSGALALLVPIVEEFGIAAVDAQAVCRPVVAPAARAPWRPSYQTRPASLSGRKTPMLWPTLYTPQTSAPSRLGRSASTRRPFQRGVPGPLMAEVGRVACDAYLSCGKRLPTASSCRAGRPLGRCRSGSREACDLKQLRLRDAVARSRALRAPMSLAYRSNGSITSLTLCRTWSGLKTVLESSIA
jgi:hypothetical protein